MLKLLFRIPWMLREPRHWNTVRRFASVYDAPLAFLSRYLTKSGDYPHKIGLKVRGRPVELTLYHPGDLDTTNQIFCRNDYPAQPGDRIFVDIGANIGLSTRFFCAESDGAKVYSFEPSPDNIEKLRVNTRAVANRVELIEAAVADYEGTASFVTEPVGRYSHLEGVGDDPEAKGSITVPVVNTPDALDKILDTEGHIDVLKVDIEGMEETVLRAIRPDQLRRIHKIFAEYSGSFVPEGFRPVRWGFVSHFYNDAFQRSA